jgi:predicted nucleic acid-binding protein
MKKERVYVDTSVIGGCFDEEFADASQGLVEMALTGKIVLVVSDLLARELALAPAEVRAIVDALPGDSVEKVKVNAETEALMEAYLKAKVVGRRSANDAHHVAVATIAKAGVILSWNFKHIVHLDKIKKFNAVNVIHGYGTVEIRSPKEFV